MSARDGSRTRGGVTVLELLFATALFALLLSLVYGSYIYAARTISRCQDGYAPFRDGLRLQKLLSRMLASASGAKQRNAKATFEGDETRISFTTLNRQGFDPDHPWPLAYVRVTGDRDDGLTILSHPTWFLTDKDDAANGAKQRFSTVRSVKFEYLDGKDWMREWDASKKGKLPRGVRLELKLGVEGGPEVSWQFIVSLPVQPDLPIVGAPGFPGGLPGAGGPGFAPGGAFPGGGPPGFIPPFGGLAPAEPLRPGNAIAPP